MKLKTNNELIFKLLDSKVSLKDIENNRENYCIWNINLEIVESIKIVKEKDKNILKIICKN